MASNAKRAYRSHRQKKFLICDVRLAPPAETAQRHNKKNPPLYLINSECLLAKGVNVNVTDNYNRTALHWAAYNGHTDVAQVSVSIYTDVAQVSVSVSVSVCVFERERER